MLRYARLARYRKRYAAYPNRRSESLLARRRLWVSSPLGEYLGISTPFNLSILRTYLNIYKSYNYKDSGEAVCDFSAVFLFLYAFLFSLSVFFYIFSVFNYQFSELRFKLICRKIDIRKPGNQGIQIAVCLIFGISQNQSEFHNRGNKRIC